MATISSALYSNIDGGNKLLRYLYNNAGGVRRNTNAMYGNLDGSSRQVFPISATGEETVAGGSTIYTWNKYNITKIPKLYYSSGNNFSDIHFLRADKIWKLNSYNVCLNSKKTYGDIEIVSCELYGTFGDFINRTIPDSVIWVFSNSNPTGKLFNTHGGLHGNTIFCGGTFDTIECDDGDSGYGTCVYAYNVREYFVRQEDGKGSTSYGTVTSTSRSAYPDNNYSGSYWYVYAGSTSTGPTVYKWNRYTKNTTTSGGGITKQARTGQPVNWSTYVYEGDTILYSTSPTVPYSGVIQFQNSIEFRTDNFDYISNLLSTCYWCVESWDNQPVVMGSVWYGNRTDYAGYDNSGEYHFNPTHTISSATPGTSTISQGSYIDQVSSTSRNAYPDNNYSGNYWYVYQGSSQGSGNTTITVIYEQIPAIQSSGTQYIDTGFTPNQNTRVVLDAQLTSVPTGSVFLFGARTSGTSNMFSLLWYLSPSAFRADYGTTANTFADSISDTERILVDFNKNNVNINNVLTHTFNSTTFTAPSTLTLCCVNEKGTKKLYSSMKIYSCKIYDNGTLVRDYIPVKGNNGAVGLYDLVNSKFYGNSGSGSFTAVLPEGQLTAIQSSGTQYIDTGLTVNKSDSYEILLDAQLTNNSNYAGANGYLQYQANIAGGIRSNIKISYNGSTGIENVYVNNVLKVTENWTSSYNGTNVKIGILALGDTNNVWWSGGSPQSGTVYSVKITKSGVLVRDFVPYRNSSGAIGMYDLVNSKFYANAGTGSFTAVE